ncbi:hypothetical protein NLJ89_g5566 [Agrocybe chaxingu]|uniref:Uncharacterized protein n=1 Tax=Agrocybe chaxingu TaxID=84603 RepID=A0A9W8K731_9AGAR|nr:hypothetical protein NLJ89_g5566 [Agrocybe chaxingu]
MWPARRSQGSSELVFSPLLVCRVSDQRLIDDLEAQYQTEGAACHLTPNSCGSATKAQHRVRKRFQTRPIGFAHFAYRAIENGANFLAEGFVLTIAARPSINKTRRSSQNQSHGHDSVDDSLKDLGERIAALTIRVGELVKVWERGRDGERERNDELSWILKCVVEIGLRGE